MIRIGKSLTIYNDEYNSVCSIICDKNISDDKMLEKENEIYTALATNDKEMAEENIFKAISGTELDNMYFTMHIDVDLED